MWNSSLVYTRCLTSERHKISPKGSFWVSWACSLWHKTIRQCWRSITLKIFQHFQAVDQWVRVDQAGVDSVTQWQSVWHYYFVLVSDLELKRSAQSSHHCSPTSLLWPDASVQVFSFFSFLSQDFSVHKAMPFPNPKQLQWQNATKTQWHTYDT